METTIPFNKELDTTAIDREPFITVVIPAYNESHYIEACLKSLLDSTYPVEKLQVFVVDGRSTDNTVEIVKKFAETHPFVAVLDNPRKHQAAAFNIAVAQADPRASLILRADAHAVYPSGFIQTCAQSHFENQVELVVYFQRAVGTSCFQKAVAFAWGMPAAVGNSWYRIGTKSRFVNHGLHGCFRKSILATAGVYDETIPPNEDAELSTRIRAAGGKIFLDERLNVTYYPRSTVQTFALQQARYGKGWYRHLSKHGLRPQWRHLLVMIWVALEPLLVIGATFNASLLVPIALYASALAGLSIYAYAKSRDVCTLLVGVVVFLLHHSWTYGYLSEMYRASKSKET